MTSIAWRHKVHDRSSCQIANTSFLFDPRGQAKIVVDPSLHESQYPNLYPLEDPDKMKSENEDEFIM